MSSCIQYSTILERVREKAEACGRKSEEITIVAVTKQVSVEKIKSAYGTGCRNFGESRVQHAVEKIGELPDDCRWHFIGTLQSNKVGKVLEVFDLIHSVDTPELVHKISQTSAAKRIVTPILLQVNTSGEKTKHGLSPQEWEAVLERVNRSDHVQVQGLMTMAPLVEDEQMIRACFRKLCELREKWQGEMRDSAIFRELSMGMSHDYEIAIEEGATLLRIGTAIFAS